MSSVFKVFQQLAESHVIFTGVQPIAALPFTDGSTPLVEQLGLSDISVESESGGQALHWVFKRGGCRIDDRIISIDTMRGSETHLAATVQGGTEDATAVLDEIWSMLCRQAEIEVVKIQELGTMVYSTTAVVGAPFSFDDLFPELARIRKLAEGALSETGARLAGTNLVRVTMNLPILVGNTIVARPLVIEPHRTSTPADRVLFTRSPLTTEQHASLLQALADLVN